jgi:hypothetical protein
MTEHAAEHAGTGPTDVEALLRTALRPIEPPEKLTGRMEETLSSITQAAAEELSAWAEELEESELRSLRDPRNWVRPAAAVASGTLAGAALVVLGLRNRSGKGGAGGLEGVAKDVRSRLPKRD